MAKSPETLDLPRSKPSEPKASILLVDDNPANLLSLRAILEDLGQNLVDARSGEEAVQRVQEEEFAVVLLDVLMPGISGFETAKLIRGQDRSRHTPIIFLTASDIDRPQIEKGYALGAVDFLVKPLLPVVLQSKVRGFVELFQDKQRAKHEADQLRLLVEGAKDYAIFRLDREGHVASWNPGAERIKGYKANEIIGQHFTRFYPQDAIDRGWPAHELKVARAEGRFEDEGWRLRKDGTQFWANVIITALHDEAGSFVGFSKITRDLTERKKSEENARRLAEETAARQVTHQERERLRVTLASIGDAVISTDAEGRVDFLNPVAQELVGWKTEEAASRTLEDVFRIVNEDTRQPVENPALRALKDGVIVGLANHTVLIAKDGKERPIDDSAAPIRDAGGNVLGSVLVFRDISEKKQAEAALKERVRLLTLNAAVGAALVQADQLRPMLQRCAEALVDHLHGAFARIWTLNPQGEVLELQASTGLYTHLDGPHSRVPVGKYKIGLIAQERKPHLTNAVAVDPRVSDQEWAQREGMVAFAGYPLLVDDRLVGVMAMFARHALTDATLEAMASVANGIALGVERKVAEEKRRQQEEWLRVTLASIGDAMIATDTHGRVTFLNGVAQELTGWRQQDAEGKPLEAVFVILNEKTRQPVENPVEKVLREGVVVGLGNHTVLIARDGTERPIDDSAAPIRDTAGEMIGVVLIFRDVTEQRRAERDLRASEARKSAILVTALDCIITMDHDGNVVEFNPAAEKTFGYCREHVIGRQLADLIIPPSLRERHHKGMAHYLATGEGPVLGKRLELPALRADGTEFPVELAIIRIPTDGPPLFTAYLRDITEQKRAEQHRNVRLGVTHALSEASSVDDGASGVLRAVCDNLGWDVGFFWTFSETEKALVCRRSRHRPDVSVDEFERASCSRTFKPGEELPGRVWSSGKPAWILDIAQDTNFPRLTSAVNHGLHSAFACPVVVGDQTLGVIEFFTKRIREADADLLEMMGTVAGNVGQFIERKAAEDDLRRSEQELADFFENATVGLHWVGADGTILRTNRAELEMLGYSREEYVGRHIADFHADEDTICDILKRLQAGEKLDEYPARLKCKDGSIRDVLIDSSVMFRDGQFVHTRCFTRDVTERKRVERELRESEQRFARFMQYLPGLAWIKDVRGRYVYANDAAEKAFGTARAELYGKTDEEVFPPETAAQFQRNDKEAMSSATGVQVVEVLEQENGVRHSLVSKFPILGSDGRVALVGGMAIDITEQSRVEQALRHSEERFRSLMDQAPFSIQVFSPDGRTSRVNRAWEALWGVTLGQIGDYNILEDRQLEARGVLPYIRRAFAGEPAFVPAIQYDPNETIPDRTKHTDPVRWVAAVAYPLKDDAGQVREVVLVHQDITAQRRAEAALRESEEKLRLLADTIPQLAWMARPDGHIFWYNRRWYEYTGTTPEQMEGWGWQSVHAPDVLPRVLERWKGSIASGVPFDMVFPLKGADDEFRPFLTRVNPLRDEKGRILYWFGTNTDISEIKRMEEALRDADRRKDEFLATLAHELRNPLAPIRNSLQILKMPRVDAATAQQTRDMMERQVHHLVRLVDDLLDVSRVMRGKIELRKELVELATVVARAVETAQPLIEVQGHRLDISLPPESLLLDADPVRLAQVVGNLLTNAAKYTESNGRIWLTARREGDQAVLRVRDNGIGIAPDMLPHVFELFVQVDHASTKAQGGLGIGLTLVKNLVEMHNGTVEARSAGLGKGCEFVIRLPLMVQERREPTENENGEREQNSPPSGHRLLVVDDNQDAAVSLAMLLRLQGHEVQVAHDGPSALASATTFRPDMVFLDIGMPGMDGYEVARRMRQQPGLENVVLAALTGWGQQEDRRRSAEAGFNHHLVKPPEPKALESVLAELKSREGQ